MTDPTQLAMTAVQRISNIAVPNLPDPCTVFKDGKSSRIHRIDLPAWAAQGWSLVEPQEKAALPPVALPEPPSADTPPETPIADTPPASATKTRSTTKGATK